MPDVFDCKRGKEVEPCPCLGDRVVHHGGDQAAVCLEQQTRPLKSGIKVAHLGEHAAGKWNLGKLREGEEAGPVAVLDVMAVVGDVVGE